MIAIVAVSENWGIGKDNALLFHIHADMKRFRALTSGHTVIMGRKTLQSLPGGRPLPKRRNIVLSSDPAYAPEGVEVARSPAEAAAMAEEGAFCIGGESVYRAMLPYCDRVYLTCVYADAPADAFFPDLGQMEEWAVEQQSELMEEDGVFFRYIDYVRVKE